MSREVSQKRVQPDLSTFRSLAVVMLHPKQSLPLLNRELKQSTDTNEKINYAKVLAALGSESGREVLLHEVKDKPWDKGFGLTTHRETGNSYSDMDRLIIALGNCAGKDVQDAIMEKLRALDPKHLWSHYRSVAIALQNNRTREAAEPLVELLESPRFTGHAQHYGTDKTIVSRKITSASARNELNDALRELTTAGMLYSVGDHEGMGRKILEVYRNEIGGHLARYAEAYLEAGQK